MSNYQSGLGSLFLVHAAAAPIHDGEPCCVCGESDGELETAGHDEVLGLQWIHTTPCKSVMEQAVAQVEKKRAAQAVKNVF